jgi:Mitochondrial carrier protein
MSATESAATAAKPATTTNMKKSSSNTASDVTRRMICGGVAGMVAKTATNPLDRIRMLAQTGGGNGAANSNPISVFEWYRNIVRTEGVLGLWAGNGANLLRVFPSKAVVFASNDVYKKFLQTIFADQDHVPISFLAGGMSGMSATALTYPLDLARGRISGKLAMAPGATKHYSGIITTIALTAREEGVMALWRGALPTLLGAMPYEGIKFGTVGVLETYFPLNEHESPTPMRKMLFGGMGGVMAGLITYPNDTVRRLLQLQGSRGTTAVYTGYWDCVRQTYRADGIGRFYRGIVVNIVRMAPNTAVQFGSYELLKQWTADWV